MTYANKKQPHIFAMLIGKIHVLSWGEQHTVVIMGRTRYI